MNCINHIKLDLKLTLLLLFISYINLSGQIGWVGGLNYSPSIISESSSASVNIEVWKDGVTNSGGQGAGITCEIYYGEVESFGGSWSNIMTTSMTYSGDVGNNDIYSLNFGGLTAGLYEFTCRCSDDGGSSYTWSDSGNGTLTVETTVPVKLKSFSAYQLETAIILEWNVLSEVNNDYFTIEKKVKDFWKNIGMIYSKYGRSSSQNIYQFIDANPSQGKNIYRLTQTDYDGTTTELGIKSVHYESIDVTIYPNPFINMVNIKLPESQTYQTRIIDMTGRVINNHSFRGDFHQLDLQNLTPGQYHINIFNQDERLIHSSTISKLR